ncbi:hypothetical protein C6Y14_14065 [Streptomyces dioscori]|uniref:Four-carbon acid sugar kinase nucleotide binding domain-containing protein n=1 Tax=Streptomyces dioscori TaxID=2109333 RepID=A0A2P8Q7Y4_9ACTN|nr:nucleotide-binding domain containing protein [Streptomyces dioscori]PSM42359.1 hypothetical protein C6Y14_14065 [Streptomyces dioscori]
MPSGGQCLAGTLASHLVDRGVRRLLVAGGEASGAVAIALGVRTVLVLHADDNGIALLPNTT